VPPIDSSSHVLHISDCLDDLKPGDHVEIQWRRNNEFPYGTSHPSCCAISKNSCLLHVHSYK